MRRFWRGLVIFLLGAVLGTAFGVALGFFYFPFVFPPPAAMEELTDRSPLVATGTFVHANPSDPVHWGRGKVSVYERAVFLESDFEVRTPAGLCMCCSCRSRPSAAPPT